MFATGPTLLTGDEDTKSKVAIILDVLPTYFGDVAVYLVDSGVPTVVEIAGVDGSDNNNNQLPRANPVPL